MASSADAMRAGFERDERSGAVEAPISAVSWPAIFSGAFAAASTALILSALGAGLGFAAISPWGGGASATAFTVMSAIWLIVVQWLPSGLGGYITGRLRTKWAGTHTHEVFFRDTANGLVTWAVATAITAALLLAVAAMAAGGAARTAATMIPGAGPTAGAGAPGEVFAAYDLDRLFRPEHPDANIRSAEARGEAMRIFAMAATAGTLPAADHAYLAGLVAAKTGVSPAQAEARVNDALAREQASIAKLKQQADTARKAASALLIFLALSMLIGAFVASAAAALGGRQRDEHF